MNKILSVIIPVYNEERTVTMLLDKVYAVDIPGVNLEILIVNDGSKDKTADVIGEWAGKHENNPLKRIVTLDKINGGKGSAVREGIRISTGDILIIQDADLEYEPIDYAVCIEPILKGEAKIVYGSREDSNRNRIYSSPFFYLGGLCTTFWINLLYNSNLTDEPTCYKTFDGPLIRAVDFEGNHFEWEPEITGKLLRMGYEIKEVIVTYHPRSVAEGKKIRLKDGFSGLWSALKWRFMPINGIIKKAIASSPENATVIRERRHERVAFSLVLISSVIFRFVMLGKFIGEGYFTFYKGTSETIFNSTLFCDSIPALGSTSFFYDMLDFLLPFFHENGLLVMQIFLGALTVIPLYLTARLITSWKLATLASFFFIFSFAPTRASALAVPDTLFLFLMGFQLYFFMRFYISSFGLFLIGSVFIAAIASLMGVPHNIYWLVPALLAMFAIRGIPLHLKLNYLFFSLLTAGILFVPLTFFSSGHDYTLLISIRNFWDSEFFGTLTFYISVFGNFCGLLMLLFPRFYRKDISLYFPFYFVSIIFYGFLFSWENVVLSYPTSILAATGVFYCMDAFKKKTLPDNTIITINESEMG